MTTRNSGRRAGVPFLLVCLAGLTGCGGGGGSGDGDTVKFSDKRPDGSKLSAGEVLPGTPDMPFQQYRNLEFTIEPEELTESQRLNAADYRGVAEFKNSPVRYFRTVATFEGPEGGRIGAKAPSSSAGWRSSAATANGSSRTTTCSSASSLIPRRSRRAGDRRSEVRSSSITPL